MSDILDALSDGVLDILVDVFNIVFSWCADFIFKLWSFVFDGAEERGKSIVSSISSMLSNITFDNFILLFFGFSLSIVIVKVTLHIIQILRGWRYGKYKTCYHNCYTLYECSAQFRSVFIYDSSSFGCSPRPRHYYYIR
mgnify:CR=1 FL=1